RSAAPPPRPSRSGTSRRSRPRRNRARRAATARARVPARRSPGHRDPAVVGTCCRRARAPESTPTRTARVAWSVRPPVSLANRFGRGQVRHAEDRVALAHTIRNRELDALILDLPDEVVAVALGRLEEVRHGELAVLALRRQLALDALLEHRYAQLHFRA